MILLNLLLQLGNPDLWSTKVCIQQIPFLFNGQRPKALNIMPSIRKLHPKSWICMDLLSFYSLLWLVSHEANSWPLFVSLKERSNPKKGFPGNSTRFDASAFREERWGKAWVPWVLHGSSFVKITYRSLIFYLDTPPKFKITTEKYYNAHIPE